MRTAAGNEENSVAKRSWTDRVNNITQTALNDYVDIMAFLILGAILAAGGKYLMKQTDIHTLFQQEPTIAILISVAVFAAMWPAWRASRVNPVTALRHELTIAREDLPQLIALLG